MVLEKLWDTPAALYKNNLKEPVPLLCTRRVSLELFDNDMRYFLSSVALSKSAYILLNIYPSPLFAPRSLFYPRNPQCLPRLADFNTVTITYPKIPEEDHWQTAYENWFVKFNNTQSTEDRCQAGTIVVDMGPILRKKSPMVLRAALREPLRGNHAKVDTLTIVDLRELGPKQRQEILILLLSSLPDLRWIRFSGCSPTWLTSFGTALAEVNEDTSPRRARPLCAAFTAMAISTTELRRLCEANTSSLSGGKISLRECELESDAEISWKVDVAAIGRLNIGVSVVSNT